MLRRFHRGAARRSLDREVALPDRSSLMLARQLVAAGSAPGQRFDREELAERVRRAVAQLPAIDREILVMRTFEELSYEEIGYLLEIKPSAARQRYGRALIRLQSVLSAHGLLEDRS